MNSFRLKECELLLSPQELIQNLGSRMDALSETQPSAGNPEWTRQVKSFLGQIGKGLEKPHLTIEVIYTKSNPGVREFLLDVVWWCRRGENQDDEFMALAAEIEWSSWGPSKAELRGAHVRDRVAEDFGKLTVVKSPLKLMIFCTECDVDESHGPMQQIVLDEMHRYLECFAHHVPGEHYVFLDVASKGHRRAWVRSVDKNGVLLPLQDLT